MAPPPPVARTRQASPPPPPEPPAAAAAAPPPPLPTPSPPPTHRAWPGLSDAATPDSSHALWVSALEDEIVRSAGAPLSLLVAELEDAERVAAVESREQARAVFGRFAGAVRSAVRRQDILVCESEARAWIIARETSRGSAQALGERISVAVRCSEHWQGAPLVASIGVAVFGEDGRTSGELIEAAEEARFSAAASGVDVRGADEA
jgi:GGDEF domain-containing protein